MYIVAGGEITKVEAMTLRMYGHANLAPRAHPLSDSTRQLYRLESGLEAVVWGVRASRYDTSREVLQTSIPVAPLGPFP